MSIRGSMAFITALWSALALAIAMLGLGVYQWIAGGSPLDLLLEHGMHVLLFGALIHLVLALVLRWLVASPIQRVGSHLYGIGTGQVTHLDLDSPIREIRQLVQGVNLMVERFGMRSDASDDLAFIRAQMGKLGGGDKLHREVEERFERLGSILGGRG